MKLNQVMVGAAAAVVSFGALAQTTSTGPDLSAVTAAAATVAAVGAAVFAVKVGIKLFKWISSAL